MDVRQVVRPECSLTTAVADKDAAGVRYDVHLAFEECSAGLKMFADLSLPWRTCLDQNRIDFG